MTHRGHLNLYLRGLVLGLSLLCSCVSLPSHAEPTVRSTYGLLPANTPSLDWSLQRFRPAGIRAWQVRPDERAVVAIVSDTWPRQPYLERYRVVDALGRAVARHRYSLMAITEAGTIVGRYACADNLPDSPTLLKRKPTSPIENGDRPPSTCQLSLRIETPLVLPSSGQSFNSAETVASHLQAPLNIPDSN